MKINENIAGSENYLQILKKDVPEIFQFIDDKIYLKNSKARPFRIEFPLFLNEDIAKISAMVLDGCILKDLKSCMFAQKKDRSKVTEFSDIVNKLFNVTGNIYIDKGTNTSRVDYPRKALVNFFYFCLNIHKCDESARIPNWIWNSPKSVVIEYLRYAFAMEGSIGQYLKGTEIKFHSVDLPYLEDLKKILREKFDIYSNIQKYYIKEYGWKYYLTISSQDGVIKFQEVGFALESHQSRLTELVASFKNKAWEITLIKILNEHNYNIFTLKEACCIMPYLCKRAVHHRLSELLKLGYLQKEEVGYFLTDNGRKVAINIKNQVKFTELRTNPRENEHKVFQFLLMKGESYRNEIARELKITPNTIRDTLKRLSNRNKIQLISVDKFQRKYYKVKTD
ncbi:hypothetical protein HYS31_04175 [Candidatus Woesearchaeota archaeon]|nr:hypothetical protein [Candidatus Woesearchaeota archaeon]